MSSPQPPPIRFANFLFDPVSGDLVRASEVGSAPERGDHRAPGPERLPPKPARLLARLLETPGEVISREALVAELWPDQHLDVDANLAYTVREVRKVLGDDASNPRFIETLPRRGFRFIAPVESGSTADAPGSLGRQSETGRSKTGSSDTGSSETGSSETGSSDTGSSETGSAEAPSGRRRVGLFLLVATPLLMLILSHLDFAKPAPTAPEWGASPPSATHRVALLPLRPPPRLAQDADALAANRSLEQRLLVALARQPGLDVVGPATTASLAPDLTPREIGTALKVDYTVSGGVAPDEQIVFLQVIRTADGGHLFAHRYPAPDLESTEGLAAAATELATAVRPESATE